MTAALSTTDLTVGYHTTTDFQAVLEEVSISVDRGELLGVVGPSGSGKSTLALACLGLLPPNAVVRSGTIRLGEQELQPSDAAWPQVRGKLISAIFQDPLTSLNPTMRVAAQMRDVLRAHTKGAAAELHDTIIHALEEVGLPEPDRVARAYPHELSGGMRQRVQIAMALLPGPSVLLADEPTSALDVSLAGQIGELLASLCRSRDLAVLLISHDVALVSRYTDKVAVISSGRIADTGPTRAVLEGSAQAEVREMIDLAVRRFERQPLPPAGHAAKPLVSVRKATVSFPGQGRNLLAVNEADLDVFGGECLALLGESGSGKTTLARVLAGLQRLHSGTLEQDMPAGVGPLRLRRARFSQVIRQEGVASLSPAFSVSGLLAEPGIIHHFRADPASALQQVGLGAEFLARRPHELSGGQARRVGIARALTITPRLLIADEPTSGLDAPVAEEILELLRELRDDGRATLLITHDIDAAKAIADRVAIMHAGRLVEVGPAAQVLTNPEHPETIRLLSSRIDPRVE